MILGEAEQSASSAPLLCIFADIGCSYPTFGQIDRFSDLVYYFPVKNPITGRDRYEHTEFERAGGAAGPDL